MLINMTAQNLCPLFGLSQRGNPVILLEGFTYLKQRLQGNKIRWGCQYACKGYLPDWILIYFVKNNDEEYKCSLCEEIVKTGVKTEPVQHIKNFHKEIYDLHKDYKKQQDPAVGFQIELLELSMKDNPSSHSVMVEEIGGVKKLGKDEVLLVPSKKRSRMLCEYRRKRSWVWKYFDKLTNIIYRCNLCNAMLSIKGCNTNNMNRHVRTRHPSVYKAELESKLDDPQLDDFIDPLSLGWKEEDVDHSKDTLHLMKQRRSWIWSYFTRMSGTLAQCKLCQRTICHGGNATGNMNRHLKMVHNKTAVPPENEHSWIWKVFENEAEQIACKICHFKCVKFDDDESSTKCILHHLKTEHGVVSSDQIITETEYEIENIE